MPTSSIWQTVAQERRPEMTWKPYPAYKPSGVEWLGDVPRGWDVRRSDRIIETERRQIPPSKFAGIEVFHYSIPAVQEHGTGILENGDDVASGKQRVTEPVVMVSRLNPRKATVCRAEPQGALTIASTEFVALKTRKCDLRFLEYLVNTEPFWQRLDSWVQSVTRSHQRVSPEHIYRFWNAWPDPVEQRAIASFLDRETGKIDRLVAKKRELIEKLKEERAALVSRAVTRGLNPDAKLKPSGVEWLRGLPQGWDAIPLKWRARTRSGDGIATEDVHADASADNPISVIGGNGLMGYCAESNVRSPVIVIGRVGALCGNVHQVTPPAWITDNALILTADPKAFDLSYLAAVLRMRNLNELADKTAQPLITGTRVRAVTVPKPPLSEQRTIADYLDRETGKIDRLAAKVGEAIGRLQEYRAALITAAVTGKIDVRDEAAKTLEYPEAAPALLKAAEAGAYYGRKNTGKNHTDKHGPPRTRRG
jgi:type I restriction enzyme S subunit